MRWEGSMSSIGNQETQVLPKFITGEFVPDEGPGCLESIKFSAALMLVSGFLGFVVGCLTMGALLAVVMFG